MTDPISIAASVVSLVTQTQHVITAVSGLRTFSVHRGLLDRLWLFQKIISRSADVLPRALDDELFRQHHQETMQLCLAQCARLIPQLEDHIHKATKNPLRSVLLDQNIVGALEQLETWSKLLSEEMNQWKMAELHKMVRTLVDHEHHMREMIQGMMEQRHEDRSRVPRSMVEDLLNRCSRNEIPEDVIKELLIHCYEFGPQGDIPSNRIDQLLSECANQYGRAIPRNMIEGLLMRPHSGYEYLIGMLDDIASAGNTHRDDNTRRSSISTTENDPNPAIATQETSAASAEHTSLPETSRVSRGLEHVSERLRELSTLGTERPFLFPFVIVPDDPQAPAAPPVRVKLDSGCDLNWISTRILKRAGLEDKQEQANCDKAWLGFSGGEELIVPQATITISWYSVNAAYTHRHEFLVHDQVPFDVVLGSEFIMEEGWKKSFNDPVLALRYSNLSDDQLREIHHKARQSKEATDAQRQAEREMRSRDRQARRQLGLSRTGTPRAFLSPAGSQPLSRRISVTTLSGHSSMTRSPLSAQQSLSATSENPSNPEPAGPLFITNTQMGAVSDDLEDHPVVPSVTIETELERDAVGEVR